MEIFSLPPPRPPVSSVYSSGGFMAMGLNPKYLIQQLCMAWLQLQTQSPTYEAHTGSLFHMLFSWWEALCYLLCELA